MSKKKRQVRADFRKNRTVRARDKNWTRSADSAPEELENAASRESVRGNADLKTPLKFVRFEPMVVPKKSLTGASTERVDTRVLQVIYSMDKPQNSSPMYVGQQVDIFINAADTAAETQVRP